MSKFDIIENEINKLNFDNIDNWIDNSYNYTDLSNEFYINELLHKDSYYYDADIEKLKKELSRMDDKLKSNTTQYNYYLFLVWGIIFIIILLTLVISIIEERTQMNIYFKILLFLFFIIVFYNIFYNVYFYVSRNNFI